MRMDELTAVCSRVTLAGSMVDALGNRHEVDETIDIATVWEDTVELAPTAATTTRSSRRTSSRRCGKAIERIAQTTVEDYWRRRAPPEAPDDPKGTT